MCFIYIILYDFHEKKILQDLLMILLFPVQDPWASSFQVLGLIFRVSINTWIEIHFFVSIEK